MLSIINYYKIIVCPNCGLIQYVKEGQRTRKCPNSKCRKVINLKKVIVYERTPDIQKAVRIVQSLKEKNNNPQKIEDVQPILDEEENT